MLTEKIDHFGNPVLRWMLASTVVTAANGVNVSVIKVDNEDYISLTDMLRSKDGYFFFSNWLRNRNTVEFLGIWEKVNNPVFNYAEFDTIKSKPGIQSVFNQRVPAAEGRGAKINRMVRKA